MCEHSEEWNEFPDVTVGGPPGSYGLPSPVTSFDFVEYKVISATSAGVNPGIIQISGRGGLGAIDTSGASKYNGVGDGNTSQGFIPSQVILIAPNQFIPVLGEWTRVANTNGHLAIRIDGVIAAFVTIKQRVKIIKVVPAPFVTVSPDEPEAMNVAREQKILQAVYGDEGRLIEYGRQPGPPRTVRQLATGTPPQNAYVDSGPTRRGA